MTSTSVLLAPAEMPVRGAASATLDDPVLRGAESASISRATGASVIASPHPAGSGPPK